MGNIQLKSARNRVQRSTAETASSDADELKNTVRDALLFVTPDERTDFIQALEIEMRKANLSIRQYLIPLGISARTPAEMTPTEAGHLVRFLKINIPHAMPAVERAMARFGVFADGTHKLDHILAA